MQTGSTAPIKGTENKATNIAEQIQKAPLTFTGWKMRDKNIPIVNGKSIRNEPPRKFTLSNVQPTPILP